MKCYLRPCRVKTQERRMKKRILEIRIEITGAVCKLTKRTVCQLNVTQYCES